MQQLTRRAWYDIVIKVGILTLLLVVIYKQLFIDKEIFELKAEFLKDFQPGNLVIIAGVSVMMFLNWGLEARKWQLLMRPITRVNFFRSMEAIFCGVTFAIFTPNRIGEYGGRILVLESRYRMKAVIVTLVGSFAQIAATLIFGTIALMIYLARYESLNSYVSYGLLFLGVLFILFILLIYFNIDMGYRIFKKIPFFDRFKRFLRVLTVLQAFRFRRLFEVLQVAMLRYIVFTVQYLLLIQMFGIDVAFFEGMMFIAAIFLVQTMIPAPAVAELGIRNGVSVYFFKHITGNYLGVYSAATALWIINLIIPAIIGAGFIMAINIFKRR